jgi:hypothetical protein
MKKIAFYTSVPLIFMIAIVISCIEFVASVTKGITAVVEVLVSRWEYWTANIKPGEIINCPWKQSLMEVFGDAYQGY